MMPSAAEHDRGVEQHRAEDQRLDVAGAVALHPGDEEARPDGGRDEPDDAAPRVMNTFSGSYIE